MAEQFIKQIASYVMKYAPEYGIKVYSPIIAQAILESARGTSELAINACNYFGLKYKLGRCPTASSFYVKKGSEQNKDGTYTSSEMMWFQFDSMEECVIGYFDFINIPRYANLKGVTDPKVYLERIKEDGYATSLKYVDNLLRVIETYNLTQYDTKGVEEMPKIIAIDAGHGMKTSGKRCLKAIDPNQTREWWLNDRIADRLEALLAEYDCKIVRVDDTTGAKDISMAARVKTANNANADFYISIHHNAGINGGSGGGTVVYYASTNPKRIEQAQKLYNFVTDETKLYGNRCEQVIKKGFYVIKNTKMAALLIENGFMDSKVDTPKILTAEFAEKSTEGIFAFLVSELGLTKKNATTKPTATQNSIYYPAYTGKKTTLSAAMTSLGINSTYAFRKKIAKANGFVGYMGTATQNTQMYNLLVAGLLKKA